MKWKFKKAEQILKYCIEKTYEIEVKSSASALDEHNKDFCLFCTMLKNCKQYTKDPLLL